jgi:hypothetical protein
MVTGVDGAARGGRAGVVADRRPWDSIAPRAGRLLRSPGRYALLSAPLAIFAVLNPRAAPDWFFVSCLAVGFLALLLALWGGAVLGTTLRSYRAEAIGFADAMRGMSCAARQGFRAGQLAAIALALGLAAGFALAFPGLAVLAALLTPAIAVALAALPGAAIVPRHADSALGLVVPLPTLPGGSGAGDRFRTAWRFAARMQAVRAAVADRQQNLPAEARDIAKALDGGGMIRPPVTRVVLNPVEAVRLRFRALEAVFAAAVPVALVAWLLAALVPPGALPQLPSPADLWAPATVDDPPAPDAPRTPPVEDPAAKGGSGGPVGDGEDADTGGGPGSGGGSGGAGQADGGQPGGSSAEGLGGGPGSGDGSAGAGQAGGGQPGREGAEGAGDGQGSGGGSAGAWQAGGGQPGREGAEGSGVGPGSGGGSAGAGQAGGGQPGREGAEGSSGGQGSGGGSAGAGQAGGGQPGGSSAEGSAAGQSGASADPPGTAIGPGPGGTDDRKDAPGTVLVPGSGAEGNERGRVPAPPAASGGETIEVGAPPSLFAPPGSAPPAVLQDMSGGAETAPPPSPVIPPRQRLPAWIANLYQ